MALYVDLDIWTATFLKQVKNGLQVIGISAPLTTTMNNMKDVIEAVEDMGMRDQIMIVIGGTLVTKEFAEQIGADGFVPDASGTVQVVKQLLN